MEQLGEMFNRQKMALISKWGSTFIAYYGTLSGMISLKSKFEMSMECNEHIYVTIWPFYYFLLT